MTETVDQPEQTRLAELQAKLQDACVEMYDGHNAAEIAGVLKGLMTRFEGSVDLDSAEEHLAWTGQSPATVEHPITGEKYTVYFTADGSSVKVPVTKEES